MSPIVSSFGSLSTKSVGFSNHISYVSKSGQLYSDTTYNYIVYQTSGTFLDDFIVFKNINVDILVIGGGGAAGCTWQIDTTQGPYGGGGGAGGVIYNNSTSLTAPSVTLLPGKYSIVIGKGGSAELENGGYSRFGTQTIANGGGAGGGASSGIGGATGGGGSSIIISSGIKDASGQGYAGGAGTTVNTGGGGGGGGATGIGQTAVSNGSSFVNAGNGGSGLVTFSSWSMVLGYPDPTLYPYYALAMGGGGGAISVTLNPSASPGIGGSTPGSGGTAAYRRASPSPRDIPATPGYSGIVMIRFLK